VPRETFLDPEGKPFEIETDLLASPGCAVQRFRERSLPAKGHRSAFARVHASTKSSRYGTLPGGVTYSTDFKHPELHLCAHGQALTLCSNCLERCCSCPGSPKHNCTRAA
jgi:hypothetical protein